jgi:hypothetical protein
VEVRKMGKAKEHFKTLSELSEKIMVLGESIKKAEKDMESVWMDQVEEIDLRNVKDCMKSVEDALHLLQEEVSHMAAEHCKGTMDTRQK